MNPEDKKVFNLLGLATKSGNVVSGEFSTEKAVKERKTALVIVADDASDNTKKMFTNMCTYYNVPIYFFGNKDDLGHAMGKEFRASLAVFDKGLADAIEKILKMSSDINGGSKYGKKENIFSHLISDDLNIINSIFQPGKFNN